MQDNIVIQAPAVAQKRTTREWQQADSAHFLHPFTDFGALAEGYVSVTPVQLDLTAYRMLEPLQAWNWPQVKPE